MVAQTVHQLIDVALEWAANSVPVFPCLVSKAPLTENGHKDASLDPAEIREMFLRNSANAAYVGGAMGEVSGLFALDFDLYKGKEPREYLQSLKDGGMLPATRVHKTKNGGLHVIYSSNTAWPNCKPCEGVEVKGEGGYIILSGSPGYTVEQEGLVAAPDVLIKHLEKSRQASQAAPDADLRQNILDATDFHDSMVTLSARMAKRNMSQVEVQKTLLDLLENSVASNPRHSRHMRWSAIISGNDKELSRSIRSGYVKYNPASPSESMYESIDGDQKSEVAAKAGFFSPTHRGLPDNEPVEPAVYPKGENPFEGLGRYADEDRDILDVKFHMYPIFAESETVIISAAPKTGKTALALTTALHIASGYSLGALDVRDAGPTLYYGLEGQRAINDRIESWKRNRRDKKLPIPDHIPMLSVEKSTNFYADDRKAAEAARVIAYNQYCIDTYGCELKCIFIDTLTKAMIGGDQNSADDTAKVFEFVSMIRDGGVKATVIYIHHTGKDDKKGPRGSSNIEAEADVIMSVAKDGNNVNLTVDKARSFESGFTFAFEIHPYELGTTTQGYKATGIYIEPIEATVDAGSNDLVKANKTASRLRVAVDFGVGEHDADLLLGALYDADLLPDPTDSRRSRVRGKRRPSLQAAYIQKFLREIIKETGTPFGSHMLRSIVEEGSVVAFQVGEVSY